MVFDGQLGSAERSEADPADKAVPAPVRALPHLKRGRDAPKIS
jgi:hypothetical protein